ncbi:MAG: hypothetical protein ACPHQD_12240 [Vibrio toranzoniae]|uniref:hypothetical protein n=1 Tax=Vibrio toranzoniae TaxID=1194427 RepID=UPI003B20E012
MWTNRGHRTGYSALYHGQKKLDVLDIHGWSKSQCQLIQLSGDISDLMPWNIKMSEAE